MPGARKVGSSGTGINKKSQEAILRSGGTSKTSSGTSGGKQLGFGPGKVKIGSKK